MPKGFFDFQEVAKTGNGLDEFIKGAEKNIKKSTVSDPKKQSESKKSVLPYVVIFILLACLLGLGYYTFNIQEIMNSSGPKEQVVEQSTIESNIERKIDKVISGNGFSILVDRETPENFKINESEVDFNFLDGKMGSVTKILAQNNNDLSGIEVYVSEFDNKLDIAKFTEEVKKSLGSNYDVDETSIEIAKGFRLNKISSLDDVNSSYYLTVTSENYYVIKYDNSAKKDSSLAEYSKFIDLMIENLYLN